MDYEYSGLGNNYLGLNMKDKTLKIMGNGLGKSVNRVVSFEDVRGVRNFHDKGFFLQTQGVEIDLADVDTPVVRVAMSPNKQSLWISRLGAALNLKNL